MCSDDIEYRLRRLHAPWMELDRIDHGVAASPFKICTMTSRRHSKLLERYGGYDVIVTSKGEVLGEHSQWAIGWILSVLLLLTGASAILVRSRREPLLLKDRPWRKRPADAEDQPTAETHESRQTTAPESNDNVAAKPCDPSDSKKRRKRRKRRKNQQDDDKALEATPLLMESSQTKQAIVVVASSADTIPEATPVLGSSTEPVLIEEEDATVAVSSQTTITTTRTSSSIQPLSSRESFEQTLAHHQSTGLSGATLALAVLHEGLDKIRLTMEHQQTQYVHYDMQQRSIDRQMSVTQHSETMTALREDKQWQAKLKRAVDDCWTTLMNSVSNGLFILLVYRPALILHDLMIRDKCNTFAGCVDWMAYRMQLCPAEVSSYASTFYSWLYYYVPPSCHVKLITQGLTLALGLLIAEWVTSRLLPWRLQAIPRIAVLVRLAAHDVSWTKYIALQATLLVFGWLLSQGIYWRGYYQMRKQGATSRRVDDYVLYLELSRGLVRAFPLVVFASHYLSSTR